MMIDEIINSLINERAKRGLSLGEVARDVGYTEAAVWAVESGKRKNLGGAVMDLIDYYDLELRLVNKNSDLSSIKCKYCPLKEAQNG